MVRLINCTRRRADVSVEEFRKYWQEEKFDTLLRKLVKIYRLERYAKNLTLAIEANIIIFQERQGQEPYDGILEYWWPEGVDPMTIYESFEGQSLFKEVTEYQKQFIDHTQSAVFFTEYEEKYMRRLYDRG